MPTINITCPGVTVDSDSVCGEAIVSKTIDGETKAIVVDFEQPNSPHESFYDYSIRGIEDQRMLPPEGPDALPAPNGWHSNKGDLDTGLRAMFEAVEQADPAIRQDAFIKGAGAMAEHMEACNIKSWTDIDRIQDWNRIARADKAPVYATLDVCAPFAPQADRALRQLIAAGNEKQVRRFEENSFADDVNRTKVSIHQAQAAAARRHAHSR